MEKTTQRLDKYLANLGLCSRRNVAALLTEQVLTVNGVRIHESGKRIHRETDTITLNGNSIQNPKLVYFILNKPKGIVSTASDEYGRKNIVSFIDTPERIYPVGRLDKDTTGLILLTNDGELTNLLTHPRYHVDKVYRLAVKGKPTESQLNKLRNGVMLEDGKTHPAEIIIIKEGASSILEVKIHEGRKRQVRRMCEVVGLPLLELSRVKFGPILLGDLPEGKYRQLSEKEVQALKNAAIKD